MISLDEDVYNGLVKVAGTDQLSGLIERIVRPYIVRPDLEAAYRRMSQDLQRESEAVEWSEGVIGDLSHEAR
jgi:predicted CopG family antitoxin